MDKPTKVTSILHARHKVKLYLQNGYLSAKIRMNGKLRSFSSGIKLPDGMTLDSLYQRLGGRDFSARLRIEKQILIAKSKMQPDIDLFRKTGYVRVI